MSTYVYYGHELYHHGINGQKWGVRRFQNEDGSLTPEGEKRYRKLTNNLSRAQSKLDKFNKKSAIKIAKYDRKAAKYNKKAYKAANPILRTKISDSKWINNSRKASKFEAKSLDLKAKQEKLEAKVKKAQALVNEFNSKTSFNKNSINSGKKFVDEATKHTVASLYAESIVKAKYPTRPEGKDAIKSIDLYSKSYKEAYDDITKNGI